MSQSETAAVDRIHHAYSPSTLQAREASPCWEPAEGETIHSRAGTKQHDAFASRDLSKLSDEQAEAVEMCLAYYDRILRGIKERSPQIECITEEYLPVDNDLMFRVHDQKEIESTTAGYIDRAIISMDQTEADLIDLKFGKWPVEPAETNLQGMAYLLGLKLKYPKLKKVHVHFLMPYLDTIDTHTFYERDFAAIYLRVKQAVFGSLHWQDEYHAALAAGDLSKVKWYPTTSTCLFCGRLGKCGAALKLAAHVSQKYHPIDLPKKVDPLLINDPNESSKLIKLADLLALWAKAVRKEITEEAIRTEVAPEGYKFVSSSQPSIKNSAKILEVAEQLFGLSREETSAAISVTLGPLEEAISDKTKRGEKKARVAEFRDHLDAIGATVKGNAYTYLQMIKGGENAD